MEKELLITKYTPHKIDDLILDPKTKELLKTYLQNKTIPHCLFCGNQGIGKSVLSRVIVRELGSTLLYINCGQEGNVDTIRTKVKEFCDAMSPNPEVPKIVILDESDSVGIVAQAALRNTIDEAQDDTRFILTCNYIGKIIGPIQSRCTPIKISFSMENVLERVIWILKQENMKIDKTILTEFFQQVIKSKFPDIRSILNNLEHWIADGTFKNMGLSNDSNIEDVVAEIMKLLPKKEHRKIREYLLNNEDKFSKDYQILGSILFNEFKEEPGKQLMIADYLYKMTMVLDKEIQFYAMMLELMGVRK